MENGKWIGQSPLLTRPHPACEEYVPVKNLCCRFPVLCTRMVLVMASSSIAALFDRRNDDVSRVRSPTQGSNRIQPRGRDGRCFTVPESGAAWPRPPERPCTSRHPRLDPCNRPDLKHRVHDPSTPHLYIQTTCPLYSVLFALYSYPQPLTLPSAAFFLQLLP